MIELGLWKLVIKNIKKGTINHQIWQIIERNLRSSMAYFRKQPFLYSGLIKYVDNKNSIIRYFQPTLPIQNPIRLE